MRGGDDDLVEAHEINVTPFIDVMLVLLIIFMVAAPLATVDLGVDLPASAIEPSPRPDKPVFVTVKPDLSVAVGERHYRPRYADRARSMPPPRATKTNASICAPTRPSAMAT